MNSTRVRFFLKRALRTNLDAMKINNTKGELPITQIIRTIAILNNILPEEDKFQLSESARSIIYDNK